MPKKKPEPPKLFVDGQFVGYVKEVDFVLATPAPAESLADRLTAAFGEHPPRLFFDLA